AEPRLAVGLVHHARTESGALRFGRLPREDLQARSGRTRARRAWKGRQAAQTVRLGAPDRMSGRERAVRRGNLELARAEAGPAPGQGHDRHSAVTHLRSPLDRATAAAKRSVPEDNGVGWGASWM